MSTLGGSFSGGRIEQVELNKEMQASYLDYAMSVIVGRALPDVRDGLKPVHRRVLYSMHEMGLQPNRPYRKSARVVGDTMGKYHPHGDTAIYDTLVRMAQEFSMRQPLVDGQGNFGSIDGDSAAAMRYTECRLESISTEMLRDIGSDTVNFGPNYDESQREPLVLPARFPNLLVNGSSGIAVGMATNMAPHNLNEVCDAVMAYMDDPSLDSEQLMEHIKGPDFPTAGIVNGLGGIRDAYLTGRGRVVMQARAHIEQLQRGKTAVIVTELPYQVNKSSLLSKIKHLANDKIVPEITGLRDESDRNGIRVVVELKREAVPKVVLNKLFKHTQMQSTFGVNNIALVEGVPQLLTLRDLVHHYVEHQREVITRRTKFQADKAKARAHILAGYLKALDQIDKVVAIIRGAANSEVARSGLITEFDLSDKQAQAILDLRLARLTQLSVQETKDEYDELQRRIAYLEGVLRDDNLLFGIIKEELGEIRDKYGNERRTEITASAGEIDIEDMIADNPMAISITKSGYIKRTALNAFRQQGRGGVGVAGFDLKDEDYVSHMFTASMHDYILFITSVGKIYRVKVYELPEGSRQSKGKALVNLLPLRDQEEVRAVYRTRDYGEGKYLVFATRNGVIKKTEFKEYDTILKTDGIIAVKIKEGDALIDVILTNGEDDILMVSAKGQACRFNEEKVRSMGRSAAGVRGMKLREGDRVIAVTRAKDHNDLLLVTRQGFGKRTQIVEYPTKNRGTMGVIAMKGLDDRGELAGAQQVRDGDTILMITTEGTITRQAVNDISQQGRATQGVSIMKMREGHELASFARVIDAPEVEDQEVQPEQSTLDTGAEATDTSGDSAPPDTEATDSSEAAEGDADSLTADEAQIADATDSSPAEDDAADTQ